MDKLDKYLPSKKFISVILFLIITIGLFIGLFWGVKGIVYLIKNKKNGSINKQVGITVSQIIQKDSNKNGIADWEEYLWGLDPNKNGSENKDYILAKKKTLEENGVISIPAGSEKVSDNEMLSQEFFATIISLQQTGELDANSMNSVAGALGKNIETNPIPDVYSTSELIIQNDSTLANTNYHSALTKLINKYSDADIGSELTLIIQGLGNKDAGALYAAATVASSYTSFGNELISIPVPRSLATTHLSMANNYEKVGQTINDLTRVLSDPLVGMKAIINYKKYSDLLASDLEKVSTVLQ